MLDASTVLTLGRYALHAEIASGGMATVYLGRLQGPVGFSRVVAIKRMHPHIARDPDFAVMFLDEAALAAQIQHPNVVATLDVVSQDRELFIVMEYIKGESLAALLREDRKRIQAPVDIAVGMMTGVLAGLHAAHEACSEDGAKLNIVHRDVSPQNVLVGLDGLARIVDFGVAKAAVRAGVTRDQQVKGKLCYMSPEQMSGRLVDRRADVFAAAAVAWEMLSGRRLFRGDDTGALVAQILSGRVPPLSEFRSDVPLAVEEAIKQALERNADQRFHTAQQFADALEDAAPKLASPRRVGSWVAERAAKVLAQREELISQMRSAPGAPTAIASGAAEADSERSGVQPGPAAPRAQDDVLPAEPDPARGLGVTDEASTGDAEVTMVVQPSGLSRAANQDVAAPPAAPDPSPPLEPPAADVAPQVLPVEPATAGAAPWASPSSGTPPLASSPSSSGVSSVSSMLQDASLAAAPMPSATRAVLIAAGGVAATVVAIGAALAVLTSSPGADSDTASTSSDLIPVDVVETPEPMTDDTSGLTPPVDGEPTGSGSSPAVATTEATAEPSAEPSEEPLTPSPAAADRQPTKPKTRFPPRPPPKSKTYLPDLP